MGLIARGLFVKMADLFSWQLLTPETNQSTVHPLIQTPQHGYGADNHKTFLCVLRKTLKFGKTKTKQSVTLPKDFELASDLAQKITKYCFLVFDILLPSPMNYSTVTLRAYHVRAGKGSPFPLLPYDHQRCALQDQDRQICKINTDGPRAC